ncbi:hypothetical protein B2M26_03280 [Ferroacidibacillus organovorans]|uniref:Thioredoxin domain-containing protein n=2 Tax=Ferroacidibacillus organovorans TaxID=1765683 RepID=A0A1V4EW73_9BACL|nr:hypothetical protein B2M26_03280 [Ferroacidibacillus organovorans]
MVMRFHSIRIWIVAVLILVMILVVIVNQVKGNPATLPEPGYQAPPFRLMTFNGGTRSLSQYRGKDVFINFWASWCPPCQAETPDLVRMYRQYGKQVVFLGINLTGSDTVQSAKGFIQYYHIPYTVLEDPKDVIAKKYDVIAIPTSLFINGRGIIVNRVTGGMSKAMMQENFKALINH